MSYLKFENQREKGCASLMDSGVLVVGILLRDKTVEVYPCPMVVYVGSRSGGFPRQTNCRNGMAPVVHHAHPPRRGPCNECRPSRSGIDLESFADESKSDQSVLRRPRRCKQSYPGAGRGRLDHRFADDGDVRSEEHTS